MILIPLAWILWMRLEGEKPLVKLDLASVSLGATQELALSISDGKSGLRKVWVGLVQEGKEVVLLEKVFPPAGLLQGGKLFETQLKVPVAPKSEGLVEGPATLRIAVRDYSWRSWFHGNLAYEEIEVKIDTRPPELQVLSRAHNISPGGTGLVIYTLSEACPVSGVQVGENFFQGYSGYFDDAAVYLAFFALTPDQNKKTELHLKAVDAAGNQARAGFYHRILKKRFKSDRIFVSDGFLNAKMPEFEALIPADAAGDNLQRFLWVNGTLRKDSYARVREVTANTQSQLFWEQSFQRLPNAKRMAGFADSRDYIYQDKVVDHQVHMGVDLAAFGHDEVPAANHGKVVFQGDLGIYGKTIIIDHGFGLFSMYSHLSRIDVTLEQMVRRGETLGLTGTTGLAGGDHLHFAMMVHQTYVNPIEWWDSEWIVNNVTSKLEAVGPQP